MVGTAQVGHVAAVGVEDVGRGNGIAVVGVVLGVVDDVLVHGHGLLVDHGMRVGVDRDLVVAGLQHPRLGVLIVIRGHVVILEGDRDGLRIARLQQIGLLEGHQVRAGLLDASVGVRRVVVDLDDVLAGGVAGVGHGHVERHGAVRIGHIAHLLRERGVGQAVAERILHRRVIVDRTLVGRGLVVLVAHVDALDVVHERRGGLALLEVLGRELSHVLVLEVTRVVVGRLLGQVIDEGVRGLARRVGGAGEDVAQGGEAGLAGRRAPQHGLDLRIVLHKAQLEDVRTVVDKRDLVEVRGDQVDHVLFGLAQLEEGLAVLEVLVLGGVVVVGDALTLHVLRQVGALAAHAADDDDGLIGEFLGRINELLRVVGGRHLRQGPILLGHGHHRAVRTVVGVQLRELLVGGQTGLGHALQDRGGLIVGVHRARTGATVDRVGRRPAEDVDVRIDQRQVVIGVLQQRNGLGLNLLGQIAGVRDRLLGQRVLGGGRAVEQRGQRAEQHHRHRHHGRDQEHQPRLGMNEFARCRIRHRLLVDGHGHDDRQHQHNADGNQLRQHGHEDVDDVRHINAQHELFLLLVLTGTTGVNAPQHMPLRDGRS